MRYAICYVSTANKDLQRDEIEDLLKQSQQNNIEKDIKGILLYSKGNFFQVLEGDKNSVIPLFTQIENDPRHHSIIQVLGKEISHGSFDSYEFDIVTEENKYDPNILKEYLEPLKGMDDQSQEVVKNILQVFIDTRV